MTLTFTSHVIYDSVLRQS